MIAETGAEFFFTGYACNLYPAPIPRKSEHDDDITIDDADDLFTLSGHFGFDRLYYPDEDGVTVTERSDDLKILTSDFLDWQLATICPVTIYHLINKVDAMFEDVFDDDAEYDKNSEYCPEDWLDDSRIETKDLGLKFIERMRTEKLQEFLEIMRHAITDESTGIVECLETEITSDFEKNTAKYADWNGKILVVSTGRFWPRMYSDNPSLSHDVFMLRQSFIRNNDEHYIG